MPLGRWVGREVEQPIQLVKLIASIALNADLRSSSTWILGTTATAEPTRSFTTTVAWAGTNGLEFVFTEHQCFI